MWKSLFDRPWKRLAWFAAIVALTYLPSALRLTYYRDDWYYAYDALVGPSGVFRYMFAIDRPARGPFFEIYQVLFGVSPLPYHLAMLFWRLGGGLAVTWLFTLLWPRRTWAALSAGLLYGLYPGFTWWVAGIEYQPMVASAALMVVSLALTVQALRLKRPGLRLACVAGAILTGWIYLSLVEYAAGLEVFRLCLLFLAIETRGLRTFWQRAPAAVRSWLIYLIIPAGFMLWRFVFFTSQRKATDLGLQLQSLASNPLSTGLHWLVNLILSFINVTFSAWITPLLENFFSNSQRDVLLGLVIAVIAGASAWLLLRTVAAASPSDRAGRLVDWSAQAIWLGLAGILLGILPIIVANRVITFPSFSHYALPASLGLVILVVGLISLAVSPAVRAFAMGLMVLLAVLTHQGLGANAVREEQTISGFWQQMAWRLPSLSRGTTLLAYYPGLDYGEDTDIVWGPANYVYYRQRQPQLPVQVSVSALTPDTPAFNRVLFGHEPQVGQYRAHTMTIDYTRMLVVVQSSESSCVRVLDQRWPTFSLSDDPALRLLAVHSQPQNGAASASHPDLPASIFGTEPRHDWCYFFEQADLAGQLGNWAQVSALYAEVGTRALHPNDQIEWMPFLMAQAYAGDLQAVKQIATRLNTEKLYRQEACENLRAMPQNGYVLSTETVTFVEALFCGSQP
jgi:hypothetical protein